MDTDQVSAPPGERDSIYGLRATACARGESRRVREVIEHHAVVEKSAERDLRILIFRLPVFMRRAEL